MISNPNVAHARVALNQDRYRYFVGIARICLWNLDYNVFKSVVLQRLKKFNLKIFMLRRCLNEVTNRHKRF